MTKVASGGRQNRRSSTRLLSLRVARAYRGFTAVGKTLADVKEFAALVRLCERTGTLERLSEMHPPWEKRMQATWGGNWF